MAEAFRLRLLPGDIATRPRNSRSRNNFLPTMPEPPFRRSNAALESRYNPLSIQSLGITVPSPRLSTVAANDRETEAPLPIENGADREDNDPRDRTTRATIEQTLRNFSSTIRQIILFAATLLIFFVQASCAIVIGRYDGSHPRPGPSTSSNLIRILFGQKAALSVNFSILFGYYGQRN
jgi:hypothetical protein